MSDGWLIKKGPVLTMVMAVMRVMARGEEYFFINCLHDLQSKLIVPANCLHDLQIKFIVPANCLHGLQIKFKKRVAVASILTLNN